MSQPNLIASRVIEELRGRGLLIDVDSDDPENTVVTAIGRPKKYVAIHHDGYIVLGVDPEHVEVSTHDDFFLSADPTEAREQLLQIVSWLW